MGRTANAGANGSNARAHDLSKTLHSNGIEISLAFIHVLSVLELHLILVSIALKIKTDRVCLLKFEATLLAWARVINVNATRLVISNDWTIVCPCKASNLLVSKILVFCWNRFLEREIFSNVQAAGSAAMSRLALEVGCISEIAEEALHRLADSHGVTVDAVAFNKLASSVGTKANFARVSVFWLVPPSVLHEGESES
jgi:hypothetical protein